MRRSKHSLSHYKLTTMDMGKLIPVACFEVLPGDSIQQSSSALIRVSPLLAPVMHPVTVRIHHWFVPHRLVWDQWEDFITGGPDGVSASAVFPTFNTGATGLPPMELHDYLGVVPEIGKNATISALPARSYNLIWNEFYRDEDLSAKAPLSKASGADVTTVAAIKSIAWEKDYFTSARPWPQKGPDVSLPLGVSAPVLPIANEGPTFDTNPGPSKLGTNVGTANVTWGSGSQSGANAAVKWFTPNLYADLTNATATNVNAVRRAFALQRYQEARAMFGSRYTEYLRYLGVRSSDARLQRPEYLGGGKQTIAFSEVLKTGAGEDPAEAIGTMKGHGIAAMRSRRYRRFFEEHGLVLSLMSVRPKTMYTEAVQKMWNRRTKEDFWQKELEQIGQQEIQLREVFFADSPTDQTTFGYQDRYAEYRHIQSEVSAEFRELLNYWHMARSFSAIPGLNESFILCDPTKRIHAEQSQHTLWCMINHRIQARRMVRPAGVGRIF